MIEILLYIHTFIRMINAYCVVLFNRKLLVGRQRVRARRSIVSRLLQMGMRGREHELVIHLPATVVQGERATVYRELVLQILSR